MTTLATAMLLSLVSPSAAQNTSLSGLTGRVIAGGTPIDFVVEVRLDSETLGKTLATAYTLDGSGEFRFIDLPVNPQDSYVLVIEQDGFEKVRYHLDSRDFWQDPRNLGRLGFAGVVTLFLTPSVDPESGAETGGPRGIDVRQLAAEIPSAAREAYEAAQRASEAGRNEEALRRLERAVELAPDFYEAVNQLGIEYLNAGRYREAEVPLEHARDLNRNDPQPLINLGTLYFQEAQAFDPVTQASNARASYENSVRLLEEAVRLDPLVPASNYYLGSALYQTGEYGRAESLLLEALRLDKGLDAARLTLVNVYTRQDRYPEALEQISAYLEGNPNSPQRSALEAIRDQIESALQPPAGGPGDPWSDPGAK